MLPARHRLRDAADFAVAVRGRRSGSPRLVVHAIVQHARTGAQVVETPSRVGFVVSKAVGGAVIRNRTKRRLRALMAARMEALPAGCDVVVRANPAAARATYAELGGDLDRLLPRVVRS